MHTRAILLTIVAALSLTAGCQQGRRKGPDVTILEQTISTDELAGRLGLRVEERDEAFHVLKNAANTVLVFTHTGGRVFVNREAIGPVGAVRRVGHLVYVPESLVSMIRPHLRLVDVPARPVAPRPAPVTPAVVVIDAGHGGKDPGATSRYGTYEKTINLQVARKVAAVLASEGLAVTMTRDDDRFIELEDRADVANRRNASLFVSIHADSAPDPSAAGFTLYVAAGASSAAYEAARAIERAVAATGSDGRGIREQDYRVLMRTRCPAILVELGYLSNARDARRLQDAAYQDRLAQALADGILSYLR